MTTYYSYPVLVGAIQLEIVGAKVDGRPLPYSMISRTDRNVALSEVEREHWSEAVLEVKVALPVGELDAGPWSAVKCVALLSEGQTNGRVSRILNREADGSWIGSVPLSRSFFRGRPGLTAAVVATVDGVVGRIIGSADRPWTVDIEARMPGRQSELLIVENDFRSGPHEWLRPFKDAPWIVETTGDMPTVHLNTSFEGVMELLAGPATAPEKAARGMLAAQIAGDAWAAMFHAAVSGLDTDEDGSPQLPGGWRESVLRLMLPDMLPGLSLSDALFEVHSRRSSGHGWAELQSVIHYAASRRSHLAKNLTTSVRTLDRLSEGAGR
ncbi:hypothetical protein [Kitasatospora sp. NPDC057223]|uniref:hypothetical protein n=1 Tax=Kitasatospora sp. NPDC057223 TaxID=3346055 RepID=UPI00362A8FC3